MQEASMQKNRLHQLEPIEWRQQWNSRLNRFERLRVPPAPALYRRSADPWEFWRRLVKRYRPAR
jgi:hypothetical protein